MNLADAEGITDAMNVIDLIGALIGLREGLRPGRPAIPSQAGALRAGVAGLAWFGMHRLADFGATQARAQIDNLNARLEQINAQEAGICPKK
jgi:hypothetical protein